MLSSWILGVLIAALLVLPVVLRLFVGDDVPGNAITHEDGQDEDDGRRDDDPDLLLAA